MDLILAFNYNLKQICTDLSQKNQFQSCIFVHIFKASLKCLSQFCGLSDGESLNLQDGLYDYMIISQHHEILLIFLKGQCNHP